MASVWWSVSKIILGFWYLAKNPLYPLIYCFDMIAALLIAAWGFIALKFRQSETFKKIFDRMFSKKDKGKTGKF
jgi:hypothetical protein